MSANPNGRQQSAVSKIVVVGDEGCGKTSLILAYLQKDLPDGSRQIPCKEYSAEVEVQDSAEPYNVMLWDVPMKVEDSARRKASYDDSDVVLLCFSIGDPSSLEHACTRWLLELKQNVPQAPIILVGLKKDLREELKDVASENQSLVSYQSALLKKETLHFKEYIECSAKHGEGVHEIFIVVGNILLTKGLWL